MLDLTKAIQQVPWTQLAHAYNRADDVPEQLQKIISSVSEDELEDAIDWFWGAVLHQGSVYSASIPSVWILLELIKGEPKHPAVPSVLSFISTIAEFDLDFDSKQEVTPIKINAPDEPLYAIFVDKPLPIEFEDDEEAYFNACPVLISQVKELFINAIPVVEYYIDSQDTETQVEMVSAGLNLLQRLPTEAKSLKKIFSLVGNPQYDPSIWVDIGVQINSESLVNTWLSSDDKRLALIGALNPISANSPQSLETLADNLPEHEWIYANFPNLTGNLHFQILNALVKRTDANATPEFVINSIVILIKKRAPIVTWKLPFGGNEEISQSMLSADAEISPILRWAFQERITDKYLSVDEFIPLPHKLTAVQHTIIETLCIEDDIWNTTDGNMRGAYTYVQLPYDRQALRKLIE